MLSRLPITLAQVNKIRKITYFLYQTKEIARKVYNNI